MDRQIQVKVRNMPKDMIGGYVVARLVSGELWYYGTWEDYTYAENVAKEFENGIIVGYYLAEGESK